MSTISSVLATLDVDLGAIAEIYSNPGQDHRVKNWSRHKSGRCMDYSPKHSNVYLTVMSEKSASVTQYDHFRETDFRDVKIALLPGAFVYPVEDLV